MASLRAPKQWALTKQETITSFEAWRQNLQYTLSLDSNFATFLLEDSTWLRKTSATPLRGLENDGEDIPTATRRTAAQKLTHLELMLGQIANYCPIIARNTIAKKSTSIRGIWLAIRAHYGFQSTGAHFLDFNDIRLEPDERPEDLYQRLLSFIDDNLLKVNGSIQHHGENVTVDEELTPSLENIVVMTWLRLIHADLPSLVKQRYGTELRSKTLASLKPEISQALDSLLEEIHTSNEAKCLRTAFRRSSQRREKRTDLSKRPPNTSTTTKSCPLCKQAKRTQYQHYLSQCPYLPDEDRQYLSRTRQVTGEQTTTSEKSDSEPELDIDAEDEPYHHSYRVKSPTHRVSIKQSPHLKAFYNHHAITLTLDTGAETSMIKTAVAEQIGAPIQKTKQTALQADGITPLAVVGEIHLDLRRNANKLHLDALVVNDLDVDILAGTPFMVTNDISIRPSKHQITIQDSNIIYYSPSSTPTHANHIRRTQAHILRAPSTTSVIWPGEYIDVPIPNEIEPDTTLAIEPRPDYTKHTQDWPHPQIVEAVAGHVRILNNTGDPKLIPRHEHFCQVRLTQIPTTEKVKLAPYQPIPPSVHMAQTILHSQGVSVDPDNILPNNISQDFRDLLEVHDEVFNPTISGYNGAAGTFEAVVNMGPVQPPQRKGRLPQYAHNKLVELQQKFDELETQGVFKRPEEVGVSAEYLNPSFLVTKPNGGHRLVTAFADVGRYSKPQPSLLPDVDSTLRTIAQWKYIIVTDLTSAFYQIPLSKCSMKYCGVATPFRGVRVYTRCAMGMPGSETALEELMCRVLGDCVQDGIAAKLADDLYCGANSPQALLENWRRILQALEKCNLHLSPSKTIICPRSTTILGWKWSEGSLSASPHRISTLSSCPPPDTVRGLRSFIGAYKVLGRVLPKCALMLAPLEDAIAGLQSKDHIQWTDTLRDHFQSAQSHLTTRKSVTLPRPSDQLWIVTDGSVTKRGLGATLYINRHDKLYLAGFFSAKLRKHQVTWLPCEVEALSIAAAVKHFSPYIIQSTQKACLLTDSKPCVQAFEKLCRGEFSASPRVTSFLSTVSRFQVVVGHLAGSANVPSDFASRNAPECSEPRCQICNFVALTEDSVVRSSSVQDVRGLSHLPFTTRSAWIQIQSDCPDLRRTHAHLKQGTRPSKKLTNIKDIKRYLNVASIARDGLLVVRPNTPFASPSEQIIIPRTILDGIATALHIKLDHPSKHQLKLVMKRHFYALDMAKVVDRVCDACHTCASLRKLPKPLIKHNSETPPNRVGVSFAADVLKRCKQTILILRETTTSFTTASIISDEKSATLRDNLARLCIALRPTSGPHVTIRVDPAPGFVALKDDSILHQLGMSVEVGRIKNVNKNPVAEKAIAELEDELRHQLPGGGAVTELGLAIAVSRLNSRLRRDGLSAHELWTQRNQFTQEQLPLDDRETIINQQKAREINHSYSEQSKNPTQSLRRTPQLKVGDLVYLPLDRDKTKPRHRYLVVSLEKAWCLIRKFTGNQLRASPYKVRISDCHLVPQHVVPRHLPNATTHRPNESDSEEDIPGSTPPVPQLDIPPVLNLTDDPQQDDSTLSQSSTSGTTKPQRFREPPKYFEYETFK